MVYCFNVCVFLFLVVQSCLQSFAIENKQYNTKDNQHLDPTEYLRRQKIRESFLSQSRQREKDWIEPHHINLSPQMHKFKLVNHGHISFKENLLLNRNNEMPNILHTSEENVIPNRKNDPSRKPQGDTINYSRTLNPKNMYTDPDTDPNQYTKHKICVNERFVVESEVKTIFSMTLIKDMCSITELPFATRTSSVNTHENSPNYSVLKTDISDSNRPSIILEQGEHKNELLRRKKIFHSYKSKHQKTVDLFNTHDLHPNPVKTKNVNMSSTNTSVKQFYNSSSNYSVMKTDISDSNRSSIIPEQDAYKNELLRRKKIFNSYKSKHKKTVDLHNPHDFQSIPVKTKNVNNMSSANTSVKQLYKRNPVSNDGVNGRFTEKSTSNCLSSKNCVKLEMYVKRWVKKLSNKLKNINGKLISISVTSNILSGLEQFSDETVDDVSVVDEMFSNLMFNITIYEEDNWTKFFPYTEQQYFVNFNLCFAVVSIMIFLILLLKREKTIYFVLISMLFGVSYAIFFIIDRNSQKLKQRKMANKQQVLSSISPSYCTTFIKENSGIFDHIKENLRYMLYNELCNKYYEAAMVNPENEVNFFLSAIDLASNAFSIILSNLFETLNTCIKVGFYDTSFSQKIIILVIFCFLMLLLFNYRFKFFSIVLEPARSVGSQVKDLEIPGRNVKKNICACTLNVLGLTKVEPTVEHSIKESDITTKCLVETCIACHQNTPCSQEQKYSSSTKVDKNVQVSPEKISESHKSDWTKDGKVEILTNDNNETDFNDKSHVSDSIINRD